MQRGGQGQGSGGRGGRMGGGRGLGPGDYCVCPSCGTKVKHQTGAPCYQMTCPNCGAKMGR